MLHSLSNPFQWLKLHCFFFFFGFARLGKCGEHVCIQMFGCTPGGIHVGTRTGHWVSSWGALFIEAASVPTPGAFQFLPD